MNAAAALRAQQRYRDDAVLSATPERLLTMLYDRLVLDIERTERPQRALRLQQRQQERMRQVRAELDGVRHHLDALRRVPPGRGDAPAYLDIDG